jgi:hypothetical protein
MCNDNKEINEEFFWFKIEKDIQLKINSLISSESSLFYIIFLSQESYPHQEKIRRVTIRDDGNILTITYIFDNKSQIVRLGNYPKNINNKKISTVLYYALQKMKIFQGFSFSVQSPA